MEQPARALGVDTDIVAFRCYLVDQVAIDPLETSIFANPDRVFIDGTPNRPAKNEICLISVHTMGKRASERGHPILVPAHAGSCEFRDKVKCTSDINRMDA